MSNGIVNFTNRETTYEQIVPVECEIGYELIGGHSIECLSDGFWSTTTSCEIIGLNFLDSLS